MVADYVIDRRTILGWSQEQAAHACGLSLTDYRSVEAGEFEDLLSAETSERDDALDPLLVRIATPLGCELAVLERMVALQSLAALDTLAGALYTDPTEPMRGGEQVAPAPERPPTFEL